MSRRRRPGRGQLTLLCPSCLKPFDTDRYPVLCPTCWQNRLAVIGERIAEHQQATRRKEKP